VDLVILPYTNKDVTHSLPFSILEAFINQTPVIVSDQIAAIKELNNSKCVQIIDFQNRGHLFLKYVKNVLKKKDYFINNGCLFLKKYCDINNYINKYLNVYNISSNQISSLSLKTWYEQTFVNKTPLVKGIDNLKKYYENKKVTVEYTKQRFSNYPFNIINKEEQSAVNKIIQNYFKNNNIKLIDLSSGDGRMLNVLNQNGWTAALDNSKEMHNISSEINHNINKNIRRIIADTFNIPLKSKSVDVVICFRFFRHFEYFLRKKLYKYIAYILNDNGIFIFDAPMKNTENFIRYNNGWGGYNIYDICYSDYTLKHEMKLNDFKILSSIPIGIDIIKASPTELSRVVAVKKL
jgi:hypothetical protein